MFYVTFASLYNSLELGEIGGVSTRAGIAAR